MPRGNPQNLKPPQSKEEAQKRGRKGGQKSGEARRRKKTMRELMKTLLQLPPETASKKGMLTKLGVAEEDQTQKMLVAVGLMKRAQIGEPSAVKMLCEIAGDIYTAEDDDNIMDEAKEFKIEFIDASNKDDKGGNDDRNG